MRFATLPRAVIDVRARVVGGIFLAAVGGFCIGALWNLQLGADKPALLAGCCVLALLGLLLASVEPRAEAA